MATIQPFCGIHFDPAKVSGLSRVLAPPVDLLDRDSRKAVLDKDPFNVARILEGTPPAVTLESWLAERVLLKRPAAAIYPYLQEYSAGGKRKTLRAFIALGKLEPLGAGSVAALEEDASSGNGPATTGGDVEPILMLYSGADGNVEEKLLACESAQPILEFTDDAGALHRLWEAADPAVIAEVCRAMTPAKLLLASGQAAYRDSLATSEGKSGGLRMMTFASLDSPGLTPRPVHRVLHVADEFDFNHFFETLGAAFDVYPLYGPDAIQGLLDKATAGECRIVTFIARPRRCLLMVPKANLPEYGQGHSESWKKLDTAVLHGVVLNHVIGIGPEKQADPEWLAYKRGVDNCVTTLQAVSRYRIAFLLNPTRMDQVRQIVLGGEPLPAHSLEFEPIVPAGLLMRQWE